MKRSFQEWVARTTWVSVIGFEAVAAIITLCALADVLFGLGWGYSWKAVLMGFGIMLWGGLIWFICRAIFRVSGVSNPGS